jgi:DNA-binding SARP family transcriptional activator
MPLARCSGRRERRVGIVGNGVKSALSRAQVHRSNEAMSGGLTCACGFWAGLELTTTDGAIVPDVTRQTRLMLACLALAGPKGLTRSDLCTLFWPDRPSAQARNSLRQGLAALRKHLADDGDDSAGAITVHSDREVVRLSAAPDAIDAHTFLAEAMGEHRSARIAAARAWAGEPLAGLEVPESVERFVSTHRRTLTEQALRLAERLSTADGSDHEALDAAHALAQRLLIQMPAAEEAHRAVMRVHLGRGSQNSALRQFELCKQALRDELQTEPDAETRRIVASIHKPGRVEDMSEPTARRREAADADHTPIRQGPRPSVAVMPFDNLGNASDEYVADGVVEEITAALSRIRDFFVIARQSAFTFKGRFVDVKEVGRELGVAYVVEGTVRRGGDRCENFRPTRRCGDALSIVVRPLRRQDRRDLRFPGSDCDASRGRHESGDPAGRDRSRASQTAVEP